MAKTISYEKLLRSAFLPAATLVLAKIVAFWLIISTMNINWTLNFDTKSFLGMYPLIRNEDIMSFTSYTDIIFLSIMLFGLVYYVLAAKFLHNTHINPKIIARLAKYNLLFLIKDNFRLYHEMVMWLIFTWIANFLVLVNSIDGRTMIGIPTFSILFTAFLTVVFIKDACLELEKKK
jgi:hypothetical protein